MDPLKKLADQVTDHQDEDEEFYDERLAKYDGDKEKWATAIDRAAYDLVGEDNIAIGSTDSRQDIGGTIGPNGFPRAAGTHYVDGLSALVTGESQVQEFLREYDDQDIGRLVLKLTELRVKLQKETSRELSPEEISNTLEALVEKLTTSEVESGVLRQPLQNTEAVVDMLIQLFGDPAIKEYADALVEETAEAAGGKSILSLIDNPQLTTPLWDHQEKALKKWVESDRRGYVNMATATGKTVLGLAAITQRFDALHPVNEKPALSPSDTASLDGGLNVLIVAGKNLLLHQWRDEFETHLNIPKHRTKTHKTDRGLAIELSWGTVEFQTSQQLSKTDVFPEYDLVILDEAHRYSKGSSNKGWRRTFENLAQSSQDILAMSGSIDAGWTGDEAIQTVLEEELEEVYSFDLPTARKRGVVADFSWHVSYVPAAPGTTVDGLTDVTETCATYFDSVSGPDLSGFGDAIRQDEIWTPQDLRSFANSTDGRQLRDKNEEFDSLANAAFSRSTRLWQVEPGLDSIVDLLQAHNGQKAVVLVQSYAFAELVEERLTERLPDENVIALTENRADPQKPINRFNDSKNTILVGPGKLLGTGIDFPDAEVAINVGKGGVNSSLVQRVGRVLRNPSGEKDATFYHLVSIPTEERAILYHEDGRRLLERIVSFQQLGDRMDESPTFRYENETTCGTLEQLTRQGASSFAELPYEYTDFVDSDEKATSLKDLCERVTTSEDPVIVSGSSANSSEDASPEGGEETQSRSNDDEDESSGQQSTSQNKPGDTSMESDSEEAPNGDLEDVDEEVITRVEEVAEREPISDDELIDFWGLDSQLDLALIVAKEADPYLERDQNGDIRTTERWKGLSGSDEDETTEGEEVENGTSESQEDTAEQETTEPESETEETSTEEKEKIQSIGDHSTEAVEAVQRDLEVPRETAEHLLDLYEAGTLVDTDTLVEEWGHDSPASVFRHLNETAGDYTDIVAMGEVKLSEEAADRVETAITSPDPTSETDDTGDDEQTPDEESPEQNSNKEENPLDHYSRLLETDTEYLVDELQRVADHALYPPSEEEVLSEAKVPFGSFIYSFGSYADSLLAAGYQIDDQRLVEIDEDGVRPSVVVAAVQILTDLLEEPPTSTVLKDLTGIQIDESGALGTWLQIVTEAGVDTDLLPDEEDDRGTPEIVDEIPQHGCSRVTEQLANFVRESTGEEPELEGLLAVLKRVDLYDLLDSQRHAEFPEFEDPDKGGAEMNEGEVTDDGETDEESGEDPGTGSSSSGDESKDDSPERVVLDGRYSPEVELDQEDQILDDILRLSREFGHPPRPTDMAHYGRFTPIEISDTIGTWDDVLNEAGLDIKSAWVDAPDHDTQLLEELRDIADRLSHRPTVRNIDELSVYSATSYVGRWGSMESAIQAAGLEYDSSGQIEDIFDTVSSNWLW